MTTTLAPLNILLVDDEAAVRTLLGRLLRKAGHNVETSCDGAEALSVLQTSGDDFDVLITDHRMPQMEGYELVQQLNQTPFRGDVLVCSAFHTPDLERAYLRLGVRGTFSKPVAWEELRDAIAELR